MENPNSLVDITPGFIIHNNNNSARKTMHVGQMAATAAQYAIPADNKKRASEDAR